MFALSNVVLSSYILYPHRVILSTEALDYVWKAVCAGLAVLGAVLCCVSRYILSIL